MGSNKEVTTPPSCVPPTTSRDHVVDHLLHHHHIITYSYTYHHMGCRGRPSPTVQTEHPNRENRVHGAAVGVHDGWEIESEDEEGSDRADVEKKIAALQRFVPGVPGQGHESADQLLRGLGEE
ncbi:hypothetical protein SAY86_010865 [Trapa natans]|uniref:Uncharacterized protein n=1 Tax=Trapa natans TaxID=22666 RepID=A0AAN7LHW3_TRANT|nr:hypothetical protein SAY86_010865 [Trapa natans]